MSAPSIHVNISSTNMSLLIIIIRLFPLTPILFLILSKIDTVLVCNCWDVDGTGNDVIGDDGISIGDDGINGGGKDDIINGDGGEDIDNCVSGDGGGGDEDITV